MEHVEHMEHEKCGTHEICGTSVELTLHSEVIADLKKRLRDKKSSEL